MNNFTPRAQQVLALARKEADRFNHNYVGTEHLLLGLIKLGQGVAVNVLQKMGHGSRDGADGSGETGRFRSGDEDGREHSLHAAGEEGSGAGRQGSEGAQSLLRRHRAHFARPVARRRRRGGESVEEPRSRYRAHAEGDPERARSEFHAARSGAETAESEPIRRRRM